MASGQGDIWRHAVDTRLGVGGGGARWTGCRARGGGGGAKGLTSLRLAFIHDVTRTQSGHVETPNEHHCGHHLPRP
jgi:hypothetical protein